MDFLMCSDCIEEVSGDKVLLSSFVYGKCNICGENTGKKLIYTLKAKTKKPEEARTIFDRFKYWDTFLQKKDEEGDSIFLSEVPTDKLKPNIKKAMHLRRGPKYVECLYAIETKKGIEFIHGYHHDEFCPAVNQPNKLKRR